MISVVLPVHNGQKYLVEAVKSILCQTYVDFEIIAIDDNSSDQSFTVLTGLANEDSRVLPFRSPGKGLVQALNFGVMKSRGEFLARMDADDISLSTRFEKQLGFLRGNPEISIVGSWMKLFTWDEEVMKTTTERVVRFPTHPEEVAKALGELETFWVLAHPSVMFRRDTLVKLGGYLENYDRTEDLDLWVRATLSGHKMSNIPEILLNYRGTKSNVTAVNKTSRYLNTAVLINAAYSKIYPEKSGRQKATVENLSDFCSPDVFHKMLTDFLILMRGAGTPERQDVFRQARQTYPDVLDLNREYITERFQSAKSWSVVLDQELKEDMGILFET